SVLPTTPCVRGTSLGPHQPSAQHVSHMPANRPIDSAPQNSRGATATTAARTRANGNGANEVSGRRLVLELAIEVLIGGDDLLEQRPVDRVAARLLLDVAHLGQRLDA